MNLVRQVAEHEILESLRVTNNIPYFNEVNALHNSTGIEELEKRLPTEPKNCKKVIIENEPLIQYFE